MSGEEDITRIRVQYTKGYELRFIGHLDMQRLWERLLRRSGLPIRYSQGYHPRARLNLASALPLGFISDAELLDFWMNEPRPLNEIRTRLTVAAPPGLTIVSVQDIDMREDALQVQMTASEFKVSFFDPQDKTTLKNKVKTLLDQNEIIRTRRKKTYDLRPLILGLEVTVVDESEVGLWMRLLGEPGATGRPDEVLDEMGYENTEYLVQRTRLILSEQ
ncbi:MAG: TIGR03936 family radical SAM-associated protein [Chloroflexota bacterium]|jgi:radical SAM-linked protein|nr:TIGR03936 family radical SAM-associated protein [Chloroflexota bacterium]